MKIYNFLINKFFRVYLGRVLGLHIRSRRNFFPWLPRPESRLKIWQIWKKKNWIVAVHKIDILQIF